MRMLCLALACFACGPRSRPGSAQVSERASNPPAENDGAQVATCEPLALLPAAQLNAEATMVAEHALDLDGDGLDERVLHARVEAVSEELTSTVVDHLVAFSCDDAAWTIRARTSFEAIVDSGTFECRTGVTRVSVERVGAIEVLVVESEECQGSVDPRWSETRTTVLAQVDGELRTVFRCATDEQHASGPCRAGPSITRAVQLNGERIRVDVTRGYDPGPCDADQDAAAGESSASSTYTWNGEMFVSGDADLCAL